MLIGFPGGASSKESTCQWRRRKRHWFHFWVGKIPQRRAWQSTTVFLPEDGQRSLVSYSPWGCKESDTTEGLSTFQNLLDSDSRDSAPDSLCDSHTAERNWSLALACIAPRNRSTLWADHLPSFKGPHAFHSGKGLFWLHSMCRRTGGTEGSFMRQSHKQITDYATEPLKVLPFCFPTWGALSYSLGSLGREWGSPLLAAHQMQKLGHSAPDSSQALLPVEVSTLIQWRIKLWHFEVTPPKLLLIKKWDVGLRSSVKHHSEKQEGAQDICYPLSLYFEGPRCKPEGYYDYFQHGNDPVKTVLCFYRCQVAWHLPWNLIVHSELQQ